MNVLTNDVFQEEMEKLRQTLAADSSDAVIDATYAAILNGENTTAVFRNWWELSDNGKDTKYERLCRFGRMMAKAWQDKTYTLRYYNDEVSSSPVMTPLDDLAGKAAAQLCIETTTPVADWADEDPMTWYVRANALSLEDGTMNVLAVEGVDSTFDLAAGNGPVYTFCLALWVREWSEGDYHYKSWKTAQAGGYRPYAGDVGLDNEKRDITWRPTFPGSLDSNGALTSCVGGKPCNRRSANTGISDARKMTAYEGLWNDADTIWILDMWQLRHFNLENSDILNGCQSYNFQHAVAKAEENVRRVLVTSAQAANLQVGSNIMIGERGSNTAQDRNSAYMYDIADNATILSKEEVAIDGTAYVALNLDLDSDISVTATCWISTAPWNSGVTEALPGHKDGACYSLTAGRNPMRVQGVEVMDGAYTIGLDPLYNVTNFADKKGDYEVFECKNSVNLAGSITANYVSTGITYPAMAQGWNYVKKFVRTLKAVLFPEKVGGSSTTYFKSGFYGTSSAGVRCPWRFGYLYDLASCGLGCESGNVTPSSTDWHGRPRLCGAGKIRGEFAG